MTIPSPSATTTSIHPDTAMGAVGLTVSDLDRSRQFYEQAVGLRPSEREDGTVAMSADDGNPLVVLRGDSAAPRLNRRATGLYHLAILLPTRRDLALALARLAEAKWPLDGASDHLVSEALYMSDPDGNGIEIYRDRPRSEWRYSDGQLEMATLPLDLKDVLSELSQASVPQPAAPAGTKMGHVHLRVSDIAEAEAFYDGVLGFDVMVRGYPGALFVSAGGYHHHLGLNTWQSAGSAPPPPGSVGLRYYEVRLPNHQELAAVLGRVRAAGVESSQAEGVESSQAEGGTMVRDPSGNAILLTAR